jgi:hypothetical protein
MPSKNLNQYISTFGISNSAIRHGQRGTRKTDLNVPNKRTDNLNWVTQPLKRVNAILGHEWDERGHEQ